VHVAQDGNEQPVLECDRETDVRRLACHKLSILDPRSKAWVLPQRLRRGSDDGVRVRRARCLALLVGGGHINVARDGELRLLADALGHALSDGLSHAREWLSLL